MKTTIQQKLYDIGEQHNIKILFACESGSRAWGFPSPDSDYDVRFIYLRPIEDYLSIYKKGEQVSLPMTDDLDVSGWDLKKVLQLITKSNTTPFEWLQSPVVYCEDPVFKETLWQLCQHYFCARSNTHHYLGIAKGAMQTINDDTIKIKKLFYVLRPLLAALWCMDKKTIAPMDISPLMQLLPKDLNEKIISLIKLKSTAQESHLIEIDNSLLSWIKETFDYCSNKANSLEKVNFDLSPTDDYFKQIVNDYDHTRYKG